MLGFAPVGDFPLTTYTMLPSPLKLTEFKPALALNPDIVARYGANRLRVVRQVRYSVHNENCIDLVLFLNGLPVATAELKTDFTQSIDDAIDQYRFDRHPRPKGQNPEPLLSFPNGALVHFAVSNREVHMVTRLDGPATRFLPFSRCSAVCMWTSVWRVSKPCKRCPA